MRRSFNGSLNFIHIGPCRIVEPSAGSVIAMNQTGEAYLRNGYAPGTYTKATDCNEILKYMFQFYDSELDLMLPKFATAWWVGGIVFQYEESGRISSAYKKMELTDKDTKFWRQHGALYRQALDLLLEKLGMLGEIDKIEGSIESQVLDFEKALICARKCVEYSSVSNYTHMIVPDATTIKIYPPESRYYLEHEIHPEIDRVIVAHQIQNNKEVSIRDRFMESDSDPFDFRNHNQILDQPFNEKFGISYAEFQAVVTGLVVNSKEISDPGKAPMSLKVETIQGLSDYLGIPIDKVTSIMDLLILDKSTPRHVWDSSQLNRINKRPLLEFRSKGRTVLMWSHTKIGEYLALLDSDLTFNKTPYGWDSRSLKSAISTISNGAGRWFEKSVANQLKKLGFVGKEIKNKVFNNFPGVTFDCGQIDYLAYHSQSKCLAIFEFKMIETGFDARGVRQVKSYFLEGKKPYAKIFTRKINWVKDNLPFIKEYFKTELNVEIPTELTKVNTVFITYYPTLLSLFYSEIPCKSLILFVEDCHSRGVWPYSTETNLT